LRLSVRRRTLKEVESFQLVLGYIKGYDREELESEHKYDDIEKFKLRISGKYPFIREKRKEMKAFRNKIRKFFGIKTKQ